MLEVLEVLEVFDVLEVGTCAERWRQGAVSAGRLPIRVLGRR